VIFFLKNAGAPQKIRNLIEECIITQLQINGGIRPILALKLI
jgi:hypothetical protein